MLVILWIYEKSLKDVLLFFVVVNNEFYEINVLLFVYLYHGCRYHYYDISLMNCIHLCKYGYL